MNIPLLVMCGALEFSCSRYGVLGRSHLELSPITGYANIRLYLNIQQEFSLVCMVVFRVIVQDFYGQVDACMSSTFP